MEKAIYLACLTFDHVKITIMDIDGENIVLKVGNFV